MGYSNPFEVFNNIFDDLDELHGRMICPFYKQFFSDSCKDKLKELRKEIALSLQDRVPLTSEFTPPDLGVPDPPYNQRYLEDFKNVLIRNSK